MSWMKYSERQKKIKKEGYCECKYGGSPSAHHDCCNSCSKVIQTIYEKYDDLKAENERLKTQLALLEPAPEVTVTTSSEISFKPLCVVNWAKLGNCPECGAGSLDIESEDRIALNYYIYCLDCRHQGQTATGKDHQEVADQAVELWLNPKDDE